MSISIETYALSRKYTDGSISGITGTLAGKNCTIQSITEIEGGNRVTFEWTDNGGNTRTSVLDVMDGKGIQSIAVNENNHLIITYSDGTTSDAGEIEITAAVNSVNEKTGDVVLTADDLNAYTKTETDDKIETEIGKLDVTDTAVEGSYVTQVSETDGKIAVTREASDSTPTEDSKKMVQSGGVYDALALKQDTIEVSEMPTASADNLGIVLIYIGATTADYTQGQSYLCVLNEGVYSWEPTASKVEVDDVTIQENNQGKLETVLKTFVGTTAEWQAVENKAYYDIVNITDDGTVIEDVYEAIHDAVNTVTSGTATFDTTYGSGDIRWIKCGRIVTVYVWFNITTAIPPDTTYITGLPAPAGMVGDMIQMFTTTGSVVWFIDANGTSVSTLGAVGDSSRGGGRAQITYISAE